MSELTAGDRRAIVADRIDALRGLLERRGAGALKLDSRRDFAWLTLGGLSHVLLSTETGVAPVVITRDDAVVLAPVNEHARLIEEELHDLPLRALSLPWWDASAADRETDALAQGAAVLSAADVADELQAARSVLTTLEHDRMRELARLVDSAMTQSLGAVKRGEREHELEARLAGAIAQAGARLPVILVAADERIERYRHPIPTQTPITRRVMVVVVAERWGLHVAATQFRELEARPAQIQERAAAIGNVVAAMRAATRPGKTFGDVLAAARAAYAENGMADEWSLHHQGGSIGYAARERIATPDDPTPIEAGMAFAWNPSAVGYKAEETLLLTVDGTQQVLTTTD